MKKLLLRLILLIWALPLEAQGIKGTIFDSKNKEPMANVSIQVYQNDTLKYGVISDDYGSYIVRLPAGYYSLLALYFGYDSAFVANVLVTKDIMIAQNFRLIRKSDTFRIYVKHHQ
jgi:hypothetical protein